ncbi:hypothetical protein D9M71_758380 [compost metagenome]
MADLGLAGTAHVLRRRAVDAGVEQHAIQTLLAQRGENLGAGGLGVEVAGDHLQTLAELAGQLAQASGGGRIARHGEHPCAALEPGAHQTQTDAARGAGDDGDRPGVLVHAASCVVSGWQHDGLLSEKDN